MAKRCLFVDSDIFILLSAAGVLEQLAGLLGFDQSEIRCLPALPHQLQRGRSFKRRYSDEARLSALKAAEKVQKIEDRPKDDELVEKLISSADIDEGEALLLAYLVEDESCLLTTGDRRCLISLSSNPELEDVRKAVAGRIVSLEVAVKMLVESGGVEAIASAFLCVRGANRTLGVIFSEGNMTNPEQCIRSIQSYLSALKGELGGDLLYNTS